MQEILDIYIKYTPRDIKEFSFAKNRAGVFNKISYVFSVIFTVLLIGSAVAFAFSGEPELLVFAPAMLIPVLFIWGFTLWPSIMLYMRQNNDFKKSKYLGALHCCKLFDDRMEICSENGSFSLLWHDIYKVLELKPCIIIQSSPVKMILIPKRCFINQAQLDLFINTLDLKIDKKKTLLKRFRLKNSMPDYGEIMTYDKSDQTADLKNEPVEPVVELKFSLTQREHVALNFRLYYTKAAGLIITAIGLFLLFSSIRNFSINASYAITPLLLGMVFTFLIPVMLYINSVKQFKRDAALQKPYIYKFYEDYYIVEHPSGTNKIKFCDLVKVKEIKTTILLFVSTQIAHIIPKRVFEGREDKLKSVLSLTQGNRSRQTKR